MSLEAPQPWLQHALEHHYISYPLPNCTSVWPRDPTIAIKHLRWDPPPKHSRPLLGVADTSSGSASPSKNRAPSRHTRPVLGGPRLPTCREALLLGKPSHVALPAGHARLCHTAQAACRCAAHSHLVARRFHPAEGSRRWTVDRPHARGGRPIGRGSTRLIHRSS